MLDMKINVLTVAHCYDYVSRVVRVRVRVRSKHRD